MTQDTERDARRLEFNQIFAAMPGTDTDKTAKVCEILGYKPHTISILRCKKKAWKVIPAAKLAILKRELQREASV